MIIRKCANYFFQTLTVFVLKIFTLAFTTRRYHTALPAKRQPYLIIANHSHAFDPFAIITNLPWRTVFKLLPIGFMTSNAFYNTPLKPFLWALGCFPARNKSGKERLYGVDGANKLISHGFSLQIFPEGTRVQQRKPAYPGVIAIHQANPHMPIMLCCVRHTKWSFLQRRWFVLDFAIKAKVHYTDSNVIMDEIYKLPGNNMIKIAIIEDDMVIAQMYRMKFEAEGFEVQTAENGRLGVELTEKMRPNIILLDIRMPEMNGDEALKIIRSKPWGKHIPVLILTNLGEEEAPQSLQKLGVHSYIVKADFTPRQVTERVKQVLAEAKASPAPHE